MVMALLRYGEEGVGDEKEDDGDILYIRERGKGSKNGVDPSFCFCSHHTHTRTRSTL